MFSMSGKRSNLGNRKKAGTSPLKRDDIPLTSSIRKIRLISINGGGAKGAALAGSIKALQRVGITDQAEEVAGSSVGAIVALMIALGMTAEEIEQEMLSLDFLAFQDKAAPGWIESTGLKEALQTSEIVAMNVGKKAELLEQILPVASMVVGVPPVVAVTAAETSRIAKITSAGMRKAARMVGIAEKIEDAAGVLLGSDLGLWKGEVLTNWLSEIVARKTGNPNLTFRELELLAKGSKGEVSRFKKLDVTVSNLTLGKVQYCNSKLTPNDSVVGAVRRSASYPFAFQAVKKMNSAGQIEIFTDGGLLENLPRIFNTPDYLNDSNRNEQGGNTEAFALAFEGHAVRGTKKIKNGIDVLKAMYEAVMSEQDLRSEYGPNIAVIPTGNVGTLQFDLSRAQKEELVRSGFSAVMTSLKKILEREKQERKEYATESTEELVRLKVAYTASNEVLEAKREKMESEAQKLSGKRIRAKVALFDEKAREEYLKKHQEYLRNITKIDDVLTSRVKLGRMTIEELNTLQNKEQERLLRRQTLENPRTLPYKESVSYCKSSCSRKQEELLRVTKELQNKTQQFRIAKEALKFYRNEIVLKFKENNFKNRFCDELLDLDKLQDAILKNRERKSSLELVSKKDLKHREKIEQEKRTLEKKFEDLQLAKREIFDKIISYYSKIEDASLSVFFVNLLKESEELYFKIPKTSVELIAYFQDDIELCKKFIDTHRTLVNTSKEELLFYKQARERFDAAKDTTTKLSGLYHILSELDKSIYQKTSFLVKSNEWLIRNAPRLEKIITPFIKLIAFTAFMVWLPVSVPWNYFGAVSETRSVSKRFTDWMRSTDSKFKEKQLGLTRIIKDLVKILSSDYVKSQQITESQLYRFQHQYMQTSGLKTEDIFIRNPKETENQRRRIEIAQKKLMEADSRTRTVLKDERFESDPRIMTKYFELQNKVLSDVLRADKQEHRIRFSAEVRKRYIEWSKLKEKPTPDTELKRYANFIKLQQVRTIHIAYIHEMENKFKLQGHLSKKEIQELVQSSYETGKPLSESLQKRYGEELDRLLNLKEPETGPEWKARAEPVRVKRAALRRGEAFEEFLKEKRHGKHKEWHKSKHKK